MPKKFQGENSKAAVARARIESQKADERQKKAEAEEDEKWRDDDKHAARKQARKAEKDAKLQERSERRAELRTLHDQEMESAAAAASKHEASEKVTRALIEARRAEAAAGARAAAAAASGVEPPPELEENLNRIELDGEHARTVEEALHVLGGAAASGAERHPEKRMRAAYTAFQERELARLKRELPGMRLSQLKQLVHKNWEKSPDNPLNLHHADYNSK